MAFATIGIFPWASTGAQMLQGAPCRARPDGGNRAGAIWRCWHRETWRLMKSEVGFQIGVWMVGIYIYMVHSAYVYPGTLENEKKMAKRDRIHMGLVHLAAFSLKIKHVGIEIPITIHWCWYGIYFLPPRYIGKVCWLDWSAPPKMTSLLQLPDEFTLDPRLHRATEIVSSFWGCPCAYQHQSFSKFGVGRWWIE